MTETIKDRIEKRAYELFMARGGHHGYAIEDWLKAEKEMLSSEAKPAVSKGGAGKTAKKKATKKKAAPKKKAPKKKTTKKKTAR
jgi:hypothetical protein